MNSLQTNYGLITGVSNYHCYAEGQLKSCILDAENRIQTPVGEMVPLYKMAEYGERPKKFRSSLSFFANGQIKSAALDRQMPITTPIGTYGAELVTFYEDGSLNRLFPLNGKIDGFWSEQNEGECAEVLDFNLSVGTFSAKIVGLHFYRSGALKSLTLWPGEKIILQTPLGKLFTRIGFSLYEDGCLKSLEPAYPVKINTPIGEMLAYDTDANGMHADENSLVFSEAGALVSLKSVNTGVRVVANNGFDETFEPYEMPSMIDMDQMVIMPIKVEFSEGSICINGKQTGSFERANHRFSVIKNKCLVPSVCASCSACNGGCSA
jgi:hypothetical protein